MENVKKLLNKYQTFIKYIFSAGICFFIDIALFTIFSNLFKLNLGAYAIILATILARVISSFINYHINRNNVFKNSDDGKQIDSKSFIKYVALVIIQMCVSSLAVFTIYNTTKINETFIKIPVECILFLINYIVQKLFIFNNKEIKNKVNLSPNMKTVLLFALAIITSFSLIVKLSVEKVIVMNRHDTDFILYSLLAIAIFVYYKKYFFKTERKTPFKILSIIFTILLIFGYSFDTVDSAFLVYGKPIFVVISLVKFVSFYSLINLTLNIIYDYTQNLKITKLKNNKIVNFFEKHPFWFSVIVLTLAFLPYIIAYYPAVMGYDPANQIKEVMGIHTRYMDSVVLLDESVTITNFNPVIHTLLLGNCFKFGVNIDNVNFGLFLYSLIQIILTISILSYSISFLKREKVPTKFIFLVLGIYALVPIYPFYSMSTNKDTIFSLLMLLYVIKLYDLIKYDLTWKRLLTMFIVCALLFLMRNNGIYTILLTLPVSFVVLKNKRGKIALLVIATFLSYEAYNKVILPHYKITSTSIREVLSIPFQQTAALIKHDEKIIEPKDKQIIANILDYEIIKKDYDPELADRVKNTFNRYYKDEDLKQYFGVWAKYLFKRPLIYIDATVNNIYGYFYPNTNRWYLYYAYNTKLKEAGFDYHYNKLSGLRKILSGYGEAFQYIPVLGGLVNIGLTVWIYMYLLVSLIISKNKKYIIVLLPAFTLILVCMASPANAYFRYALPFIMSLPVTLGILYANRKDPKKTT